MNYLFYEKLSEEPIIRDMYRLLEADNTELRASIKSELLKKSYEHKLGGDLFKKYLSFLIASDENPFSLSAEKEGTQMDEALKILALEDIKKLIALFHCQEVEIQLTPKEEDKMYHPIYGALANKPTPEAFLEILIQYYKAHGAGMMNRYKAFKWEQEKGLIGISEIDPITLQELIGCDYQKEILVKNTEQFLNNYPANNALLFGDSGTGKSSMVKAVLNAYHHKGLRLLELSKSDFLHFYQIIPLLRERGLHYIIFLDDLSFEEFEIEYKAMKALIEGGVEVKPQNVLMYATSNRRHLIRETWEERQGQDVHIADTRAEKLSLSERFGLSLTFTSPAQNAYLEIVMSLAKKYHITIEERVLREKAIQWELAHGGRSGRVAKQFIQSLLLA